MGGKKTEVSCSNFSVWDLDEGGNKVQGERGDEEGQEIRFVY